MKYHPFLKIARTGYLVLSCLFCLLGLALIVNPGFSVSLLCQLGGILLIAFGVIKLTGYLSKDLYRLAFQFDLAFGLFCAALGVLLLRHSGQLLPYFSVPVSICILADALLKIQISVDACAFGLRRWWLILTAAALTGAAGFVFLLGFHQHTARTMTQLGVCLVLEGILNFITVLLAVQVLKKQKPEQDPHNDPC